MLVGSQGSTVSRETPEEKLKQNPGATQKDLNWLKRGRQLELGPEKKALFTEQLKSDTAFMQMLGIMDYSLLVGVHDGRRGNSEKIRENALTMFNVRFCLTSVGAKLMSRIARHSEATAKTNADPARTR